MVAFRLPDGEDRSIEELVTLAPTELEAALGMPTFVLLAEPAGGPMIPAAADGTVVEAGRYVVFCFIPTGAAPRSTSPPRPLRKADPPRSTVALPHFVEGMYGEFTVSD